MRIGSVEFEKQGRVAIVTLDEPAKLNAISMGIREGVIESLARIQADDEIRVGILTGRGDKAFVPARTSAPFRPRPSRRAASSPTCCQCWRHPNAAASR